MSYIHSVRIDRKTGEVLDYKVTPSNEVINHRPLVDHMLKRMEILNILPKDGEKEAQK